MEGKRQASELRSEEPEMSGGSRRVSGGAAAAGRRDGRTKTKTTNSEDGEAREGAETGPGQPAEQRAREKSWILTSRRLGRRGSP